MTNIIPLFWETKRREDIKWKDEKEQTIKEILDILSGEKTQEDENPKHTYCSKEWPHINSFTYQWHLRFWKNFFWPFIRGLDYCNFESSRVVFQWKYYHYNNPIKSGIGIDDIIVILRDNNHLHQKTFVWVDVDKNSRRIIVSVENKDSSQSTYSYPYTPSYPEIDPQIWF